MYQRRTYFNFVHQVRLEQLHGVDTARARSVSGPFATVFRVAFTQKVAQKVAQTLVPIQPGTLFATFDSLDQNVDVNCMIEKMKEIFLEEQKMPSGK